MRTIDFRSPFSLSISISLKHFLEFDGEIVGMARKLITSFSRVTIFVFGNFGKCYERYHLQSFLGRSNLFSSLVFLN